MASGQIAFGTKERPGRSYRVEALMRVIALVWTLAWAAVLIPFIVILGAVWFSVDFILQLIGGFEGLKPPTGGVTMGGYILDQWRWVGKNTRASFYGRGIFRWWPPVFSSLAANPSR